jgi:hypothetical protein
MRNHRVKDRREAFRGGAFGGMSGFSVTLQNNRLGWIDIAPDDSCRLNRSLQQHLIGSSDT